VRHRSLAQSFLTGLSCLLLASIAWGAGGSYTCTTADDYEESVLDYALSKVPGTTRAQLVQTLFNYGLSNSKAQQNAELEAIAKQKNALASSAAKATAAAAFNTAIIAGIAVPSVTNPGTQTNARLAVISVQIVASDPDGQALTYSATGLPPGLTIGATTGLISGTIAAEATVGTPYSVTVRASKFVDVFTEVTFSWNVTT
jgi:hypothetical protein